MPQLSTYLTLLRTSGGGPGPSPTNWELIYRGEVDTTVAGTDLINTEDRGSALLRPVWMDSGSGYLSAYQVVDQELQLLQQHEYLDAPSIVYNLAGLITHWTDSERTYFYTYDIVEGWIDLGWIEGQTRGQALLPERRVAVLLSTGTVQVLEGPGEMTVVGSVSVPITSANGTDTNGSLVLFCDLSVNLGYAVIDTSNPTDPQVLYSSSEYLGYSGIASLVDNPIFVGFDLAEFNTAVTAYSGDILYPLGGWPPSIVPIVELDDGIFIGIDLLLTGTTVGIYDFVNNTTLSELEIPSQTNMFRLVGNKLYMIGAMPDAQGMNVMYEFEVVGLDPVPPLDPPTADPELLFYDDFERPDGPLAAPWEPFPGFGTSIVDNAVFMASGAGIDSVDMVLPDDVTVEADITFVGVSPGYGSGCTLFGRFAPATLDGYAAKMVRTDDTLEFTADVWTGGNGGVPLAGTLLTLPLDDATHHVELHMVGTEIWIVVDGIESGHATDSSYTGGRAGIYIEVGGGGVDGVRLDNFAVYAAA